MDRQVAKFILGSDPEILALMRQFNQLGVIRFVVYVLAAILVIVMGINHETGALITTCACSFIIVMSLEIARAKIQAKQRLRAAKLGIL